jgi:hypothetical protein
MPRFDPATWRLRIDGLVERPRELGYRDLLALRRAEQVCDDGFGLLVVRTRRNGPVYDAARVTLGDRTILV